jgi:hypothetical protein
MQMEWEVVSEEIEKCAQCKRYLSWWTEPPRHGKHASVRHAICSCQARYTSDPDGSTN